MTEQLVKMNLSNNEFELLLALKEDPFMSLKELADKLSISWPTVKKRYNSLVERKIIRNPIAIVNPESLCLQRVSGIAFVRSIENLKMVEKSCWEHPYTTYRARAFGGNFGILLQYNIPRGSFEKLLLFMEGLKKRGFVENYEFVKSTGIRTEAFPDIKMFDHEKSLWNFSWVEWFKSLSKEKDIKPLIDTRDCKKLKFQKSHLNILQDLTQNAAIKQTELMKKYSLSKSEISRQYNFVQSNYIGNIRLMYNREAFDLYETFLAISSSLEPSKLRQLYYGLLNNPPPFNFSFDILENNRILIWSNMSPAQGTDFAFSLWSTYENVKVYALNTHSEGSAMYHFYPPNYNRDNEKWNDSEEYMVTEPLERLDLRKNTE
ncbi:MAG: winged helix-turn-helix transcriptional regulator [Candidatus Heimdallarchaeota archaeon]|nr:winged helix-turn-helix transcriptional regulator [Candidatus Heimdallarchaeota archaeon]MCK5048414.1 winged helix-turn-helix transcriptional regulator [Candidatus Heimdallarchaeota archaeon]